VFGLIGQCCWFHLGKCLFPWMKVPVFIINLSVVYICFNNCTAEVAAFYQVVARVFWPSGPTHDRPLVPSLRVQLAWYPWYQILSAVPPSECLASEVAECCVLSGIIGHVPRNLVEYHQVNASCNFKRGACNNWLSP
jgi:hypothetical protein